MDDENKVEGEVAAPAEEVAADAPAEDVAADEAASDEGEAAE